MDGVEGEDDGDGGEGLELDGEGAEGGPAAVGVDPGGDADCEAGGETFEGAADGGFVVALKFFLSSKLEGCLSVTEYVVNIMVHIPSCCG